VRALELQDRELLSVRINPPPQGLILLRGATYDVYTAGGWRAGKQEKINLSVVPGRFFSAALTKGQSPGQLVEAAVQVTAREAVGTVLFTLGQPLATNVAAQAQVKPGQVQTIRLDSEREHDIGDLALLEAGLEKAILFRPDGGASFSDNFVLGDIVSRAGADRFVGLAVERDEKGAIKAVRVARAEGVAGLAVLRPRQNLKEGESYVITGLLNDVSPEALRQASAEYPPGVRDYYLQLPDNLPRRVRELATGLIADKASPYDKAKAIEGYLRGLPVDYLTPDPPPGHDAVDYFLFEAQRGYFDYHASAMVVLLRSVGVPARLAVGFALKQDEEEPERGEFRIQARDAYAWAEAYFPGYGWLEFNPTPERGSDLSPGQTGAGTGDTFGFLSAFLDQSLSDFDLPEGIDANALPDSSSGGAGGGLSMALWIFLGVALLLLASALSLRWGWQRAYAGLPYAQQVWEKTLRLATWAGLHPGASETPREYARRLAKHFYEVKGVELIGEAYNRSRFGHQEIATSEREALQWTWPRLRYRLLKELPRRLWRRG